MKPLLATSLLIALVATTVGADEPRTEDTATAYLLLEHLRYRKTKSDALGHVWYLDISEQDDVSDKTLAALEHLPHLREVYLIFCPIRGDGLVHLSRLKQLDKLDLYGTQIDRRAIKHIVQLPTLKYLDIRLSGAADATAHADKHREISDAEIKQIADHLPNLESFLLDGTISDEGLQHLMKLKKLRYVEVTSPNITADGIKRLQSALPQVTIDRG